MELTFDPMTIEHLGFKMYSHLPNAIAELIANAYDADANHVRVILHDLSKAVEVQDDGHGMSPTELADRYLRIGRNRRRDTGDRSESGRRRVAGKKGLGKLALFGIGREVTVRTTRKGVDFWTVVTLNWEEIKGAAGGTYRPNTSTEPANPEEHGTTIRVEQLQRKTPMNAESLAASLARLFNYHDRDFVTTVQFEGGDPISVSRTLRYDGITEESRWTLPDNFPEAETFRPRTTIRGTIISSVKPLRQELRGITIYVNGRLANDPEYFGVPESSYAYSYLTGYVDVDYIDDLDEDMISTDRRSINWEASETADLRKYLQTVLREASRLRRDARQRSKKETLVADLGVDLEKWVETINGPEASSVEDVLQVLTSPESEISDDDRAALVVGLQEIAPEYADLQWRHVHPSLQEAASDHYRSGDYYSAVQEAIKRYVNDVRRATGQDGKEQGILQSAFGESGLLDVSAPWSHLTLRADTVKNIQSCQREVSTGIFAGFRNLLAHEEVGLIRSHEVLTYQDCLDALSILSHLRRRLDGAGPRSSFTPATDD